MAFSVSVAGFNKNDSYDLDRSALHVGQVGFSVFPLPLKWILFIAMLSSPILKYIKSE